MASFSPSTRSHNVVLTDAKAKAVLAALEARQNVAGLWKDGASADLLAYRFQRGSGVLVLPFAVDPLGEEEPGASRILDVLIEGEAVFV